MKSLELNTRNKDSYSRYIEEFKNIIVVKCNNCTQKSLIITENTYSLQGKVICKSCGYNKNITENDSYNLFGNNNLLVEFKYNINEGNNLNFTLWYTGNLDENVFWVYNLEHLKFLKNFLNAKLRERDISEVNNKSIASRLPKWMTSKKNRNKVLKLIEKLEIKQV
ncbi:MAG: hypothetical protein H6604_00315 [Flavobacteriales bacterium]|nr:hypothetical protein [Flavobacteriales bacterium]